MQHLNLSFNRTGVAFVSTFDNSLIDQGCDVNGKFAIVTHGWMESINTPWTSDLISNLLNYRGGCVIFMDYYKFAKAEKFFKLLRKFTKISAVLLKKLRQLNESGVNDDDLFMYGFSFGARLVIDAGVNYGINRIKQIDGIIYKEFIAFSFISYKFILVCEPAGPGFDYYNLMIPQLPTLAAKNVQCIHTSYSYGTYLYNCHQNWRMGYCGWSQVGALAYPNGSHGLCNYYYNSAFENDFLENNFYKCAPTKLVSQLPDNFTMGYLEQRRK